MRPRCDVSYAEWPPVVSQDIPAPFAEALAATRVRVAALRSVGLPAQLAHRVFGETPDEVFADAEALAKTLRLWARGAS